MGDGPQGVGPKCWRGGAGVGGGRPRDSPTRPAPPWPLCHISHFRGGEHPPNRTVKGTAECEACRRRHERDVEEPKREVNPPPPSPNSNLSVRSNRILPTPTADVTVLNPPPPTPPPAFPTVE